MIEGARKMSCGACGNHNFMVYKTLGELLIVECKKCKSISIIRPTQPMLSIEWGEGSQGILCVSERTH